MIEDLLLVWVPLRFSLGWNISFVLVVFLWTIMSFIGWFFHYRWWAPIFLIAAFLSVLHTLLVFVCWGLFLQLIIGSFVLFFIVSACFVHIFGLPSHFSAIVFSVVCEFRFSTLHFQFLESGLAKIIYISLAGFSCPLVTNYLNFELSIALFLSQHTISSVFECRDWLIEVACQDRLPQHYFCQFLLLHSMFLNFFHLSSHWWAAHFYWWFP